MESSFIHNGESYPQSCLGMSWESTHECRSKPNPDNLHHTNPTIQLIELISGNVAYRQCMETSIVDQAWCLTM